MPKRNKKHPFFAPEFETNNIPAAKVTEEKIKEWKEVHGDVWRLTAGDKKCYIRKPTRDEISYSALAANGSPLKQIEVVLVSAWLAGDLEIITDDEYFLSVIDKFEQIYNKKSSELEKL